MGDEHDHGVRRVRLTGARFQGGRLPIDSLVELQKYQEIVRIAAEAEWRKKHPNEQPPTDLNESVSLVIERLDEGSADVFLAFEQHQAYVQYQADAQDAADAIIVAAYSDAPIPELPTLTREEDLEFRLTASQIGATLNPEQSIEFYPRGPSSTPIRITIETRRHAVDRLTSIDDFLVSPDFVPTTKGLESSAETLVGRVTALDANKKKFTLVLTDGREVHGWYRTRPELLEDFREVVNSAVVGPLTRITGDLQTRNDQPFRFWATRSVEQVQFDDTVWGARLAEFASLPSGWDGGEAAQISSFALDAAQIFLQGVDRAQVEHPGVFPTEEGGVLVEWASENYVRSVEILSDGGFELFSLEHGELRGEHSQTVDVTEAIAFTKVEKRA